MNKDELVTLNDLDERDRKLKDYLVIEFDAIKKLFDEQNKPYIYWGEHLSLKQAMKYTGRSRSCIDAWVKEGLLSTPYTLGGSTNRYYSKTEIDSIKPRFEARKRNGALKALKVFYPR